MFFPGYVLTQDRNVKELIKLDFSSNLRINIRSIGLKGNKYITLKFLKIHFKLEKDSSYWAWELKEKLNKLGNSGYISKSKYVYYLKKIKGQELFDLEIHLIELPIITKIDIINKSRIDLSILFDIMNKNNFGFGKIANKKNYDNTIREFLKYQQQRGIFLLQITDTLFQKDNSDSLILQIKIVPLKRIHISFIKVEGTKNLSYREILSNLKFGLNDIVSDNRTLDVSYIKIKQMGLFSSVFFEFKQQQKSKHSDSSLPTFDLVIHVKEVDLESISTATEYRKGIGVVFLAQYVNLNLNGNRDRLMARIGYEAQLDAMIFSVEYSKPNIFNDLFFSINVERKDYILDVSQNLNKMTRILSFGITGGYELIDLLSGFIVLKQQYFQEFVVDNSFNYVKTPARLNLKDQEFEPQIGMILIYNSLNDIFNPDRGIRIATSYDIIPEAELSHSFTGQFDTYFKLHKQVTLGWFAQGSYLISDNPQAQLYPYFNRRTDAPIRELDAVRVSAFGSIDLRLSTRELLDNSYLVFFLEGGALWPNLQSIRLSDIGLGIGIGFRWSPNKYHHSFLFGFPGSVNIGIKLKRENLDSPSFTLLQHRDQFFYLNLTGGF